MGILPLCVSFSPVSIIEFIIDAGHSVYVCACNCFWIIRKMGFCMLCLMVTVGMMASSFFFVYLNGSGGGLEEEQRRFRRSRSVFFLIM